MSGEQPQKASEGVLPNVGKSLERIIALRLVTFITISTILVGFASYVYHMDTTEELVRRQLMEYIGYHGMHESALFLESEAYQARFQKEYVERYTRMGDEDPVGWFQEHLEFRPEDGTYRSKPELYYGKDRELGRRDISVSMMIGANTEITPEVRRALAIGYDMINQHGPAWRKPFVDLYFSSPEKTSVSRWPGTPWGLMMDDTVEWRDEEWFAITTVEKNPGREQRWSGVLYDERNGNWMVSGVSPLDIDGKQVGMVGTDLLLDDLVQRINDETLPGAYNILMQADGRIIAHPHKTEEIVANKGMLMAQDSTEEHLRRIYELARTVTSFPQVIDNDIEGEFVAVARIKGPDWFLITIYPKALLANKVLRSVGFIFLVGMASLTVMFLVIWMALKRDLIHPLGRLTQAIRAFRIPRGKWSNQVDEFVEKASELSTRPDEIGLLAKSFVDMGGHLQATYSELYESEDRLRRAILYAPIPIMLHTKPGEVLMISNKWAEITGYTHEEIPTIDEWTKRAYGGTPPVIAEALEQVYSVDNDSVDKSTFIVTIASGEKRIWTFNSSLLGSTARGDILLITTVQDITKRRQAERALSENEENLRTTLNSIGDAVIATDTSGNVVRMNPIAERLTGWKIGQAKGKPLSAVFRIVNARTGKPVSNPVDTVLQSRKIVGLANHTILIAKDGTEYQIADSAAPIMNDTGNISGVVLVFRDVTDEYAIQEELRKALVDAERANEAKSEFLASMSHELRTPLNAILGFAQMLQFDRKNPLSTIQEEHIQSILLGGDHLLDLINEVLDLAMIESDQYPLFVEDVDASEIVSDCVALTIPLGQARNIVIYNHTSSGPSVLVQTDRLRFRQALLNLLANAVKYNKDGGSVTVECRGTDDGFLRLSVTDTGIGIPRKEHGSVFYMFHRLGANPEIAKEGTGIGLTVTKLLVERMAGRVDFESEKGVGSTFWIDLPLASNEDVLIWTNAMCIGVDLIDKDHQILISLLNRITHGNVGDAKLGEIIGELIEYTHFHFQREEAVMEACNFPDFENHCGIHKQFTRQLNNLVGKWRESHDQKDLHNLHVLLRDWLVGHIKNVDIGIAQYTKGKERDILKALKMLETVSKATASQYPMFEI